MWPKLNTDKGEKGGEERKLTEGLAIAFHFVENGRRKAS